MKPITIVIVDDHKLVREAWSYALNSDKHFTVVAECGTAEEGVEMVRQLCPDIVIMDINLPGMNGIDATAEIRKFSPGSKILGVSLHSQPAYAKKMMQYGALGYLTKNSSREEMFTAIREVYNGRKFICDEIKSIITEQAMNGNKVQKDLNSLSHREIEVINKVKEGFSSKEIAEALCISIKTVEVHRYNILKKLNLKNTVSLIGLIKNNSF
jgi:two-component system invasion response regulator UvrY